MKQENFIKNIAISVLLFSSTLFSFTSCSKSNEELVVQKSMICDDIVLTNALTNEIADIHTIVMGQYLSTGVLNKAIPLSNEVVSEINNLLLSQINDYKFNYVNWSNNSTTFISDFITCNNLQALIDHGSTFDFVDIHFENINNNDLATYVQSLSLDIIRDYYSRSENLILDFISSSNSFEEYELKYTNYIQDSLVTLWNAGYKEEYFYIKLCFDISKSTISYMTDYYLDILDNSKGPRWDKFKNKVREVWNEVKPVVGADVGGAVTGAMVGAVAGGVGAGPGAITGGCATSAGYCAGAIVNGL